MPDKEMELGSAVQLSPHGTTDQVRVVVQPEDGEPLLSLDDVYEVTGQESIGILVRSAREYFYKGRLAKESMTCLNLAGTESFIPVYDKYNARLGGESFVSKLKDGFIAVIKAIIAWLKAVGDWAVNKIKTLFGFSKTEKEIAAAVQNLPEVRGRINNILMGAGNKGAVGFFPINPDELLNTLPDNVTGKEAMTIVRSRTQSQKDVIIALDNALPEIESTDAMLKKCVQRAKQAKSNYQQLIAALRKKVKGENFDPSDLVEFGAGINRLLMEDLDYNTVVDRVQILAEKVYGISLGQLGLDASFKEANEQIKTALVSKREAVDPELMSLYQKLSNNYVKITIAASNIQVSPDALKEMRHIVSQDDATLIKSLVEKYNGIASILGDYTAFSSKVASYNEALMLCADLISKMRITVSSTVKWYNSLDLISMAYAAKDLAKIQAAHEQLTPGKEADYLVEGKGAYLLVDDLAVVSHFYPGLNTAEEFVAVTRDLAKMPQVTGAINNALREFNIPLKV